MAEQCLIRRVVKGGEACLESIAPDVFDQPVEPERLSAYLNEPGHILLVAIAGGQVVGQCAAIIHRHPDKPPELYVDEVGVAPFMRRKGVGFRLMQEMFALGKSLGCQSSWLGTEKENQAARALYDKLGENAINIVMYEYDL